MKEESIAALTPRGEGHQFLCYGDSCSGIPGGPHEGTFTRVNLVASRLYPPPELVCFLGDEVRGLTADPVVLRAQWQHWRRQEMGWVDRLGVPLYNTTGNHTTYDPASEAVFREVHPHVPTNGPSGQEGLSYAVRRGDLLLVFVNTTFSGLGGEGRVETAWLEQTLAEHKNVRHKLVLAHHPVYPVNGFSGARQRELAREDGRALWQLLERYEVLAYLCSHILAFDVQVHGGVLQILTGGAGTAALMPAQQEYHHCVQIALDAGGLRYQVLDETGARREWLSWPPPLPPEERWTELHGPVLEAPFAGDPVSPVGSALLNAWRISGRTASGGDPAPQTLVAGWSEGGGISPLWIGLSGREQRLSVLAQATPGQSPHHWYGPELEAGRPFSLQILLHTGMGPGGVLWRAGDTSPWSSLRAASPWGVERLAWPSIWGLGRERGGERDRPFQGAELRVGWTSQRASL